jgi:hypothetical protein
MSWLACGCYDKSFILQKTASAVVILIQMERKGSLSEKIVKDVAEVMLFNSF